MKPRSTIPALIALALAIGPWGFAEAGGRLHRSPGGEARMMAEQGLTLDEAVARMERQYKARAVRAEQDRRDGRIVYRIRLLSGDGRVFDVTVDAATGAVE
ncbi:MAG: PepSY domain-containing protein [Steroidobacteraceae bacterium]|jgi:uncharacterized membrane protein YkoI|nr:PepSY domain-containing protein [Steroidobacteraceae bacterium]